MLEEYSGRDEALWEQLQQLLELPAVPPFSREFYGLIAHWATRARLGLPADWTRRLLEIEMRYYRHLEHLVEGEPPPAPALERRQIALEVLHEQAEAAGRQPDPGSEVARRLIMAECTYFLERPAEVVAHLEHALATGGTEATLCFALGHARFLLALRSFVQLRLPGAELVVTDQEALQSLCLAAVNAFEGALTGGPRDGEVLWWIGRVLLAAGFTQTAQEILAQVETPEGNPGLLPPESERDVRPASRRLPDPIDDAELAQFLAGVRRAHPLSHLL
jgi:hypothetical protein